MDAKHTPNCPQQFVLAEMEEQKLSGKSGEMEEQKLGGSSPPIITGTSQASSSSSAFRANGARKRERPAANWFKHIDQARGNATQHYSVEKVVESIVRAYEEFGDLDRARMWANRGLAQVSSDSWLLRAAKADVDAAAARARKALAAGAAGAAEQARGGKGVAPATATATPVSAVPVSAVSREGGAGGSLLPPKGANHSPVDLLLPTPVCGAAPLGRREIPNYFTLHAGNFVPFVHF